MNAPRSSSVTLEKLAVSVRQATGSFMADNLRLDVDQAVFDGLVHSLTSYVLARRTIGDTRTYEVKHPASWWQHLKHTHAPDRLKRRWPVRWTTTKIEVDFKRYDTYPKADCVLPADRFGYPVRYETYDARVDSPWSWTMQDAPPAPAFMDRRQVAHELARTRAVASASRWDSLLPLDSITAALAGLAELGVNPDELVRTEQGQR